MRPDWELLMSWVAVMEAGSVSDAARVLRISQAAVSQRVKQLETLFATALLDRTTRPAQPTAAGQRLFESAKDLLVRADQMVEGVRNVSRARRRVLRFGCVDSFAATVGPTLIRGLSASSHQIRLCSGNARVIEDLLESRQLDLAVTPAAPATPGISGMRLFAERYCLVVPAGFDAERHESLLDIGRTLRFLRYSLRSHIGRQVDDYLLRSGDALERTCEFEATDPLLSLVASGMGFAISTPLCIWQARQFVPGIRVMPLCAIARQGVPYPEMSRHFHLAFRVGELGTLPIEVRDLARVAVRGRLAAQIAAGLGLDEDAVWAPAGIASA